MVLTEQSCPWVGLTRGLGWVGNGSRNLCLNTVVWIVLGHGSEMADLRIMQVVYNMQFRIIHRLAYSLWSLVHYSYGRPIAVRYMGFQVGMRWVGYLGPQPVMESRTQASRPRTSFTRRRGTRLKSNSRAFTCNDYTLQIYSVIGNGQNSKLLPLKSFVKNMQ